MSKVKVQISFPRSNPDYMGVEVKKRYVNPSKQEEPYDGDATVVKNGEVSDFYLDDNLVLEVREKDLRTGDPTVRAEGEPKIEPGAVAEATNEA